MTAFKLYGQLIRYNLKQILTYLGLFLLLFILMASSYTQDKAEFQNIQFKVNIVDLDQSRLSKALCEHILKDNKEVSIGSDPAAIEYALYLDQIQYSLVIPEDFEGDFLKGEGELDTFVGKSQSVNTFIDQQISAYLNSFQSIYLSFAQEPSAKQWDWIYSQVSRANQIEIQGNIRQQMAESRRGIITLSYLFIMSNYIYIAIAFLSIGLAIVSMEEPKLRVRDFISGYSMLQRSSQVLTASFIVMLAIWLVTIAFTVTFFVGNKVMTSPTTFYAVLSNLSSLFAITSFTVLIVHIFPTKSACSFFSTILSLLVAFFSGVFVPEEFMPSVIIDISQIFPTRWDVMTQQYISTAATDHINTPFIWRNISVMFLMGIVYLLLTIIYRKVKLKHAN
ncbi:ABC transporter permease [Hutsoniella sourekii]